MNEISTPQKLEKLDPAERKILASTCFGHFMTHFNMLVFPAVLLPLTNTLSLDMATVLGFSFWMYLLYGLLALPWGLAADRWGPLPFFILFYLGAGISGFCAAYWIDSPTGFTVCLAGIGLFSAIYHPVGLGMISKKIKRISIAMAYNGIFGNLGLAAAPLITGLVNLAWGPRGVYIFVGALNLSGLVFLYFFPKNDNEQESETASTTDNGLMKAFLILLVAMMLGGIAYRGATVITPAYFELKNKALFQWLSSLFDMPLSENVVATTITSIIFVIGMLGQYTGGRVAEKFELRKSYLIFHAFTVPMAIMMAYAANIPLVLLALVYFFFLLGMQPIENTLVARFTPSKLHHSAYGMKFILTFGVGSFSVKMAEFIEKSYGVEKVFFALGGVSTLLVITVIILIHNTTPQR